MKRIVDIGMDVHSTHFTFCFAEPKLGGENKVFGCTRSEADVRNVLKYIGVRLWGSASFCGFQGVFGIGFQRWNQLPSRDKTSASSLFLSRSSTAPRVRRIIPSS